MASHAEDRAVPAAGNFKLAIHLARVIGGDQVLAAILDPFHRTPSEPRGKWNQKILGVEFTLDPEPAADVDLDHVDCVFLDAEHRRERAAIEEQHLGRAKNSEPAGVPFRDLPARLERQSGQAVAAKCFLARVIRFGESPVGIAQRNGVTDRAIAAALFEQQRRCGFGGVAMRQRR